MSVDHHLKKETKLVQARKQSKKNDHLHWQFATSLRAPSFRVIKSRKLSYIAALDRQSIYCILLKHSQKPES